MIRIISIKWHIDDVIGLANEENITLTPKEASDILVNIKNKHDASIGINWDVLRSHISDFKYEKEAEDEIYHGRSEDSRK